MNFWVVSGRTHLVSRRAWQKVCVHCLSQESAFKRALSYSVPSQESTFSRALSQHSLDTNNSRESLTLSVSLSQKDVFMIQNLFVDCLFVCFLLTFRFFTMFCISISCHFKPRFVFTLFFISLDLQIQSWGLYNRCFSPLWICVCIGISFYGMIVCIRIPHCLFLSHLALCVSLWLMFELFDVH